MFKYEYSICNFLFKYFIRHIGNSNAIKLCPLQPRIFFWCDNIIANGVDLSFITVLQKIKIDIFIKNGTHK